MGDMDEDIYEALQEREAVSREAFEKYDKDGSGTIDSDEMVNVLADLGMLEGIPSVHVSQIVEHEFKSADSDGDMALSFEEFVPYYNKMIDLGSTMPTNDDLPVTNNFGGDGPKDEFQQASEQVFSHYARAKGQISGAQFRRATQLCNLVDKKFTVKTADVVFAKAKGRGERSLDSQGFERAMAITSAEKPIPREELTARLQGAAKTLAAQAETSAAAAAAEGEEENPFGTRGGGGGDSSAQPATPGGSTGGSTMKGGNGTGLRTCAEGPVRMLQDEINTNTPHDAKSTMYGEHKPARP
eukprot:gene2465-3202_t